MGRRRKYQGHLEHRGNTYRWIGCVGGKRFKETFPTGDKATAELLAAKRYEELRREHERLAEGLPGFVRMSDILDSFETMELPTLEPGTIRSYKDSLTPIRNYFTKYLKGAKANLRIDKVRAGDIQDYLAWRRVNRTHGGAPLNNRTLAKDRAVLHRIFTLAEMREYRQGNPVALTEIPKSDEHDPIILNDQDYDRLLDSCRSRAMLYTYTLVLGEAGLRSDSEAAHLRWEDVSFDSGFIKVVTGRDGHKTKSRKSRFVPMTARLRIALQDHFAQFRMTLYEGKRSPYVFHHTVSRAKHKAGDRIKTQYWGFKGAAGRAKLPTEFCQHDLRHRRVTTWLAAGKSPVWVQQAMGHADIKTTMHYYRFLPDHLRQLVDEEPPSLQSDTVTSDRASAKTMNEKRAIKR